jgi:hypothetical protein
MLDRLFNDDSRQRLLAGPMGPHLEALSSKLAELGYCNSQARKVVCTAAALETGWRSAVLRQRKPAGLN